MARRWFQPVLAPASAGSCGSAQWRQFARWLTLLVALMLGAIPVAPAVADAAEAAVLEVFVRSDCPHCADAKVFLAQLARDRPGLQIIFRPVDQDPQARDDLMVRSRAAGVWPPGVPTFVFGNQVMVGFDDADHAGRDLLELIDRGSAPKGEVRSALFGTLDASRLGLPLFTLALGLLDGFNPCAMWVLLFLLSLLVRLNDRRRMALVAGTFVLVSGAVYYAFMAAWLNVFLAVGFSDAVRWLLGAVALVIGAVNVKDFVAWGRGPSLSIPAAARPGLVARMRRAMQAPALTASLLAVAALAVVVNFVELLCTAGIPAIYTAVLAQQQLGVPAYYGYLGLYIVGYIADDSLMVALAVIALSSNRLTEGAGRWLKFVSGAVMLALGAVMLLRPEWLVR
jgi:glutaredoxin